MAVNIHYLSLICKFAPSVEILSNLIRGIMVKNIGQCWILQLFTPWYWYQFQTFPFGQALILTFFDYSDPD